MMVLRAVGTVCLAAVWASAQPHGLTVHTWVREDIFAGFMANDMALYAKGVAKLEEILKERPDDGNAMAWKADVLMYDAVRAYESKNTAEGDRLVQESVTLARRAMAGAGQDLGPYAVIGGGFGMFGDRLPEKHRRQAYELSRQGFTALRAAQEASLDKLPLHIKGELLAGLAQSAQRLGMKDEATAELRQIVEKLPGTVYANRAQKWIENPAAAKSSMVCLTCHEPGRMENVLKSKQKASPAAE